MKIRLIKARYFDKDNQTFWRCVIPPMGLTSLAGMLLHHGHDVKIFDMEALEADYEDLTQYYRREKPDVVGIDVRTPLINKTKRCASIARRVLPDAKILIGGTHTFIEPRNAVEEIPEADYIVRGEAEYTLPELLACIERGDDYERIRQIDGVCFRESNGNIFISDKVPLVEDLDKLPMSAHHLVPIGKYFELFLPSKRAYAMMTTRGCPYSCSFCTEPVIYGHRVRARSPKSVVDEIEVLVNKYKVDYLIFHDATFNYNIRRVKEICDLMMDRKIKVNWKVKARVDLVDEEMLKKMKAAGCQLIGYGVESASEKSLKVLNKAYTIEQVKRAFELTKKAKIDILSYYMVGTSGETRADVMNTIKLAKELDPKFAHFMTTTPMPGSKMFAETKDNIVTKDWSKFYFYNAILDTESLTHQEIDSLNKWAYISFYLRPAYILKQLLNLRGWSDFKLKFRTVIFMVVRLITRRAAV